MILKNIKRLSLLALILGLAFFYFKKENKPNDKSTVYTTEENTTSGLEAAENTENIQTEAHEGHNHDHEQSETAPTETQKNFDYKKEAEKIFKLKDSFPESKDELIALIKAENLFKKVRAHSVGEIHQRQAGALKVLALKTLFEQESNKNLLKNNLLDIAQTAKDTTIANMAKAALKSAEEGRPFFKDYPEGLANMPVVED